MTITSLDFAELVTADEKGYRLQDLVAQIGRRLNMRVESGGRGADKGRDLFFTTQTEVVHGLHVPSKILVNCKDRTESGKHLKVKDLDGAHLRVAEHGCNAFLLVTTLPATDDLVTHIKSVAETNKFVATIWQPDDIRDILLSGQNDKFRFTIAHFFPNSSRSGDANQHSFDFFAESLVRMEKEDTLDLSLEFMDGVDDVFLIWQCLQKVMEREDLEFERDLQKHYCKALGLRNDELTSEISFDHHLEESLRQWISDHEDLDWDDISLEKIELESESIIKLTVSAIEPEYAFGKSFEAALTGIFEWNEDGFKLVEAENVWERAKRIDWEIEAEMDAEKNES